MLMIGIKKFNNAWEVYFSIDQQSFTLKNHMIKREALWMKKQLQIAFDRLLKKE